MYIFLINESELEYMMLIFGFAPFFHNFYVDYFPFVVIYRQIQEIQEVQAMGCHQYLEMLVYLGELWMYICMYVCVLFIQNWDKLLEWFQAVVFYVKLGTKNIWVKKLCIVPLYC